MNRLGSLLLVALMCSLLPAEVMVIHNRDGSAERIKVSSIKSMAFTTNIASRPWTRRPPLKNSLTIYSRTGSIGLTVAEVSPVTVYVYSARGRVVKHVHYDRRVPGSYRVSLSGLSGPLARGIYFVRAKIGTEVFSARLVRM